MCPFKSTLRKHLRGSKTVELILTQMEIRSLSDRVKGGKRQFRIYPCEIGLSRMDGATVSVQYSRRKERGREKQKRAKVLVGCETGHWRGMCWLPRLGFGCWKLEAS